MKNLSSIIYTRKYAQIMVTIHFNHLFITSTLNIWHLSLKWLHKQNLVFVTWSMYTFVCWGYKKKPNIQQKKVVFIQKMTANLIIVVNNNIWIMSYNLNNWTIKKYPYAIQLNHFWIKKKPIYILLVILK